MTHEITPVTIRAANADDQLALTRLAALDSAEQPPAGPIVVAEVGGELRAALSISDRSTIADPFHRTAAMIELLSAYADASARPKTRRRRLRLRLAHA
jgi:hypothetical protein